MKLFSQVWKYFLTSCNLEQYFSSQKPINAKLFLILSPISVETEFLHSLQAQELDQNLFFFQEKLFKI